MNLSTAIIIFLCFFIFVIVVFLSLHDRLILIITRISGLYALLMGIFLYSMIYSVLAPDPFSGLLHTLLSVCWIFIGENGMDAAQEAAPSLPLFRDGIGFSLLWSAHLCGIFTTLSAAVNIIGKRLLVSLRKYLAMTKDLIVIYGVNSDSTLFAQELSLKENCSIIFVDEKPDADSLPTIYNFGGVVRTDRSAGYPNRNFIRYLGLRPGNRQFTLYCMDADTERNIQYARQMKVLLEESGIPPSMTGLILFGRKDTLTEELQVSENNYGFGMVSVYTSSLLASRVLIKAFPPCDTLRFDDTGMALDNFDALIIGFGNLGQHVLKSLVMNGQFVGSRFHAAVFDPEIDQVSGSIRQECPGLFRYYDIDLFPYDGRSSELYRYLEQHLDSIKYIVVSTGSLMVNTGISEDLNMYLLRRGRDIPVLQCDYNGVFYNSTDNKSLQLQSIYSPEILYSHRIDQLAMTLNHIYCSNPDHTAFEDWVACDSFSRASSRAAADFFPAILRCAGMSGEEAAGDRWITDPILLDHLGHTEHMRWCAFHLVYGFEVMPEEVLEERAAAFREESAREGSSRIKPARDLDRYMHACIIPWEELDALSAKVTDLTGKKTDYKQNDINSIMTIPAAIKADHDKS